MAFVLVSHLDPQHPVHFLTGTAAPCTSIFKPAWVDLELPDVGPASGAAYDEASLWWRHEALHRATLRDPAALIALYGAERRPPVLGFICGLGGREARDRDLDARGEHHAPGRA